MKITITTEAFTTLDDKEVPNSTVTFEKDYMSDLDMQGLLNLTPVGRALPFSKTEAKAIRVNLRNLIDLDVAPHVKVRMEL